MDPPSPSSNHDHAPKQESTPQPQPRTPDSDFPEGEQPVKMEIVTTPIPIRRPLSYPASPPLRTRPPSPNLYRLVPAYRRPVARDDMSDGDISESEESPSPIRPSDMPRTYILPSLDVYERTPTPESRSPSLEPDERENALHTNSKETPATMPPETPLTQMAATPQPTAQAQTPKNPFFRNLRLATGRTASEPPQERPQLPGLIRRPLSPPTSIKTEPLEDTLPVPVTSAPLPSESQQGDMETTPPQPVASTSQQPPVPPPNPARRTTRGSLAAAAAAANEPGEPPKRATPEPGAPVQASVTTWITTKDKTWLLPSPRLGISLAQIVPPDVEAPQWMRFTRAPIVWDGKTDAGGKSGRNLVLIGAAAAKVAVNGRLVTPTRSESVDADPVPTSPEDSSNVPLDGLHLLMDYRADEKPSYSYALITRFAILGSPFKSLSLGEIYTMLEAKFPWFARDDSKWRDSIRYNLSSNNWFVKTKRALHQPGVGNLWMVDEESTGGPKRPRKGRGKGSAFMDPDDDDEDGSGDEPGPSIISAIDGMEPGSHPASTSRNGTLMLTFDSKARVPLDRNQGQRGVTAHASHNLIPRIVTRQIVMSAVDQAFASPPSGGDPYVDPRERAVQALNNVPFSLSSGDPRDEPKPLKGKSVTRAAAKEEQKQHPPPAIPEYPVVPIETTPAPPWLSGSNAAIDASANDEGIGSGKDDEESLNADEEGLTPEDYWFTEPNSAVAEVDAQGPEEQHQTEEQPDNSQGQEVDMVDQSAPAPALPAYAELSRPSAPVDFSGLQGLSDVALNENQTRAKYSFSQATKSPDGILVRGKQLSPRIVNGVLTMRRQANYLDDAALFRDAPALKKPPGPPPDPSAITQPPTIASMWHSANATPTQGAASTSKAGRSGQQGRSMWGSAATQSNPPFIPGFQAKVLQAARQGPIGGPNGVGNPLDRPPGYGPNRAEPPASTSVRKRPQLAKLAPAATSLSGNIVDAPPGPLAFRLPLSVKTPPTTRRPLTPNAPPGERPLPSNNMPMSPYAPPPDSRKRKTMPQSPNSSGRLSLDARQQKVRRIELDTERRRRVNKINPMFAIGQGSEMGPAQTSSSSSNPSTSSGYHRLPPPANQTFRTSRTSDTQGRIAFTTPVTNKTYATSWADRTGPSSAGASTSKNLAGPTFGQSGFMFQGVQPSALNAAGKHGGGNVFAAFSSQAGPSFHSTSTAVPGSGTSQVSTDSMDLDDDDERPFKMVRYRMDTDGSDEEDNGRSETRNMSTNRRDADVHRAGPPSNHGLFAQASSRAGSSLSISVPVSSSRMERGSSGSTIVSPTSASRDSPILAPMVHLTPGTSTQSPRLPSINSLLRHSPARESRDSLPPLQMAYPQAADPAPTQPTTYRPTPPAQSRTQPSTSDTHGSSSAQSLQTSSRQMSYYGFLTARRSGAISPLRVTPVYSGGDENDLARVIYRKSDWRD